MEVCEKEADGGHEEHEKMYDGNEGTFELDFSYVCVGGVEEGDDEM